MMPTELGKAQRTKVLEFFENQNVAKLCCYEIESLYASSLDYSFVTSIEHSHIYIYVQSHPHIDENQSQNASNNVWSYAIRITKSYPLEGGVRLYLLKNNYQPRIFDSRDLTAEVIGDLWTYKCKLIQIPKGLPAFEEKLQSRNQKYLSMQKTGLFQLGDRFNIMELKMFSALEIFKDTKNEEGLIIGTTETHLLLFKGLGQKDKVRVYQLTRACDLQCISEIHHLHSENQVILTLYKYKNIKSFNEYEKISRKYKLEDSERFIRNILKFIPKFQKTSIHLEPSTSWEDEEGFKVVAKKIEECLQLETTMENALQHESKDTMFSRLGKNYQKIIEYFSARASCYYLIYVNKLNQLYSHNIEI